MKKNTFLFLAVCSIIITVIILLNVNMKTAENRRLEPSDNMALKQEAQNLKPSTQRESAVREIEREPAIPDGEPLLN